MRDSKLLLPHDFFKKGEDVEAKLYLLQGGMLKLDFQRVLSELTMTADEAMALGQTLVYNAAVLGARPKRHAGNV